MNNSAYELDRGMAKRHALRAAQRAWTGKLSSPDVWAGVALCGQRDRGVQSATMTKSSGREIYHDFAIQTSSSKHLSFLRAAESEALRSFNSFSSFGNSTSSFSPITVSSTPAVCNAYIPVLATSAASMRDAGRQDHAQETHPPTH